MDTNDEYILRLAGFIRANDTKLARSPFLYPNNSPYWLPFYTSKSPVILSLDYRRLYYVLLRFEALGLSVGPLDIRLDAPSHPVGYLSLASDCDRSEALSLASFKSSISALTSFSLPSYWWGKQDPNSITLDLKYIYSCFTKLPAVLIKASGPSSIPALSAESCALPLDVFKNMQSLECVDIDPRTLLGWDRLARSLRSLKIRRSGIDDLSEIFVRLVLNDEARRSLGASRLQIDKESSTLTNESPTLHWSFLRYLSLRENAITFLPIDVLHCLTSITHLDLASNLLVSVPPGLDALHNLMFLDLSDNMIDTVLGIYTVLVQVQTLRLSRNRLESICGLERLQSLVRVDLRHNLIQEGAEIGRLSTLPNIGEVWVEGNPFVIYEENYRLKCFDSFFKEGKEVRLDGSNPNFFEKKKLSFRMLEKTAEHPNGQLPASDQILNSNAPFSSVTEPFQHLDVTSGVPNSHKPRRKVKRVVQLDRAASRGMEDEDKLAPSPSFPDVEMILDIPRQLVRHGRYHTEILLREGSGSGIPCTDDSVLVKRQGSHRRSLLQDINRSRIGESERQDLRTQIDLLKRDVGDNWLKVFSGQV